MIFAGRLTGIAAALLLLSWPAWAQSTAPTNTPPGYVWTYLGPTFGASWAPGGGIIGPSTSTTVNEPALWSNTFGTALKDGKNVVIGHTGGITTTDTTAPTTFRPISQPGYEALVWKTPNLFQLTETAQHIDQFHTTMAILNNSTGAGANGPANVDNALALGCTRTNHLTTTALGEIGCIWAYLTQGAKGDAGNILVPNYHVDDISEPNWGQILFEGSAALVAPSTGAVIREVHPLIGYGITGFQDVTAVTAGAGGACRLTVQNTAYLKFNQSPTYLMNVIGIRGATECNGTWEATLVNGTQLDLNNSVLLGAYAGGGTAGTSTYDLGGPNFGFEARAQKGQNGVAFLVSRALQPTDATWGSAFRVRTENDSSVAFDMDTWGHMVIQPLANTGGKSSMLDTKYAATIISGPGEVPMRWAGNTTTIPRDNPQFPANSYPGGGALGFNFCSGTPGCAAVELWNLYTTGSSSFIVYQKTGVSTYTQMLNVAAGGSSINSQLSAQRFNSSDPAFMSSTTAPWTNGAGGATATLTNAPAAGNPTKWIAINDNGTTRRIPAW